MSMPEEQALELRVPRSGVRKNKYPSPRCLIV
jgi:hypothetical protein